VASCVTPKAAPPDESNSNERLIMLNLVVTLLIIALIAAVLGFGGIAVVSVELAKVIFFVAILLFLIAAIFGALGGRRPVL
jgi:uncharacterized membrane protein YtjA (UPF0391 family)